MGTFFVIGSFVKNHGLVDIAWGLGIGIMTCRLALKSSFGSLQAMIGLLVLIWSMRLTGYLIYRNAGKPEDFRYAGWRRQWGKHWWWRSFFQVYVLQGLLQLLVALPVLLVFRSGPVALGAFEKFWASVAVAGILMETVADFQKAVFKRNPENRDRLLMTGLWRFSRHPNYFGEAMFWWGVGMMSLNVQYGLLSLISPLLLNWLLLKVSGVPLLEAHWEGRPEYDQYRARTNRFVPGWK